MNKKELSKNIVVVCMGVVLFALIMSMIGDNTPKRPSAAETRCTQYDIAVESMERTKEQYDEVYISSPEFVAFEEAFWNGFWSAHKHCKVCRYSGHIPEQYLDEEGL